MLLPLPAILTLAVFLGLHASRSSDAAARGAPRSPVPLGDFFDVRVVREASFSHDETLVAYLSNAGGRMDVWVKPVSGGPARQLTHVSGVIHSFAFSPAADLLVYEVDEGGNAEPRIYATDSQGAPPRDLMPDIPKGARVGFIQWSQEGRSFLYVVHLPGEKHTTIHEFDVKSGRSEPVWRSTARLSFVLASPDLRTLVLQEVRSDVDFELYAWRRGDGEPTLLTPDETRMAYRPTAFSKDGRTLYYVADGGGEFSKLHRLDLETRTAQVALEREWDVDSGAFSRGWRYFVTVVNLDGTPEVAVSDVQSGRTVHLPDVPGGGALVPVAFSGSDSLLAAKSVTDTHPEALYLVDLRKGAATLVAEVLPASLRGRTLVAGKAVRIPSFDERKVPALLYSPPSGPGPFPAVIDIHGGPNAQAGRRFSAIRQYLVAKGYVVLVPNVRGSTGYGRSYASLANMDLGGGPLRDVVSCKKWLVDHARVDGNRVAIMGASYGGYMALAAAVFEPDEFVAHVDFFGFSDLKRLVSSYPPYWLVYASYAHKLYGDPNNPAHAGYQREHSPVHFLDRVKRPLLVVQGENDTIVRKDQSEAVVKPLRERGLPVHYLVVPGEGHGFSSTRSRVLAYTTMDRFLDRYVFQDHSVTVIATEETTPASPAGGPTVR
jgi:dipeptidyl aminopeptidase/acylaminoacyl peptidase